MTRRRTPQKKSPAYQWYPKDYQTDAAVIVMTLAQEGAYRRLMDTCWLENGLPTDPALLWRLAKADSRTHFERDLWPAMAMKFTERDGRFHHTRLDEERTKQRKNSKVRKLAAHAKWNRVHANAVQMHDVCSDFASAKTCLPSPIAIATAVRTKDPPNPPLRGGLSKPITRAERAHAERVLESWGGWCRHDPRCEGGRVACRARVVVERREAEVEALVIAAERAKVSV